MSEWRTCCSKVRLRHHVVVGLADRADVPARRLPGDRCRRRCAHPARELRRQAGHGLARGRQRRARPGDRRHRLRPDRAARLPADHPQRLRGAAVGRGDIRREQRRRGRQRRRRHADPDRRPEQDAHRPPPLHARLRAPRRRGSTPACSPSTSSATTRRSRPTVRGGRDRLRVRHHGVRHRAFGVFGGCDLTKDDTGNYVAVDRAAGARRPASRSAARSTGFNEPSLPPIPAPPEPVPSGFSPLGLLMIPVGVVGGALAFLWNRRRGSNEVAGAGGAADAAFGGLPAPGAERGDAGECPDPSRHRRPTRRDGDDRVRPAARSGTVAGPGAAPRARRPGHRRRLVLRDDRPGSDW